MDRAIAMTLRPSTRSPPASSYPGILAFHLISVLRAAPGIGIELMEALLIILPT
jgi:hypothetical protein